MGRLVIRPTAPSASAYAAAYILHRISNFKPTASRPNFVLGLPTGGSPLHIYKLLVAAHKRGEVSFRNVVTFNMDEYVGLDHSHSQSYHTFMFTHFFSHVDILPENTHFPPTTQDQAAESYDALIAQHGGIDLFLTGLGTTGHIAFNEPFSSLSSLTRIKTLHPSTRAANARFFPSLSEVPIAAATVGVETVMRAKEVLVIALGLEKAAALATGIEGALSHMCSFSALQMHPRTVVVADDAATGELKVNTVKYWHRAEEVEATLRGEQTVIFSRESKL